jgi:hypothetical protein
MTEIDTTHAPRGIMSGDALVKAVGAHGDLVERHYLEVKSTLDLSSKKDREKIAKYILGSANRMPAVAATAFEGYGVMLVGVSKGAAAGIEQVEMLELSKIVQPYLGANGPRWDVVWVPTEDPGRQVLVILVDPPREGQGPYPCRSNGEYLTNGRVYIRGEGETREANADEIDLLVNRAIPRAGRDVAFRVGLQGDIVLVAIDNDATIEPYLSSWRKKLLAALPSHEESGASRSETSGGVSRPLGSLSEVSSFMDAISVPEQRSEAVYRRSIDVWEQEFRSAWDDAISILAANRLESVSIQIANQSTTFFEDVEVQLHLEGDVWVFDWTEAGSVRNYLDLDLDLPRPPRAWGPSTRQFNVPFVNGAGHLYAPPAGAYVAPATEYRNGGSVFVDLHVGDLRPKSTYESGSEEMVLIVRSEALQEVRGTWTLTARGHHDVYEGEFVSKVANRIDVTDYARTIFFPG